MSRLVVYVQVMDRKTLAHGLMSVSFKSRNSAPWRCIQQLMDGQRSFSAYNISINMSKVRRFMTVILLQSDTNLDAVIINVLK